MRAPSSIIVPALVFMLALAGCYDDSLATDLLGLSGDGNSSSTGDAGPPGVTTIPWTTGGSSTEGTSAGGSSTEGTGTSSGGDNQTGGDVGVSVSVSLSVSPSILWEAGFVTLSVEHDASVVLLELWDAVDEEQPQLSWTPDEPPPPYLLTRGDLRYLTVRAIDEDGNEGISDVATVALQLPSRGTTLWEETVELGDLTQGRAVTSGYLKGDLNIVAGFDVNQQALVGRFSAVGDPAVNAPAATAISATTGVAIMKDSSVLATGVDWIGGQPRSWLASVDPFTAEVTVLSTGHLGDTATGLAVDHELGRVYISGYSKPVGSTAADARIWARTISGDLLWTRTWERPVEDPDEKVGDPNDLGLAVAVLDNHDPVLVGESRFFPKKPNAKMEHWAFVHRYDSSGEFNPKSKSWTSPKVFNAAGAHAVARDEDNGLLVAGWTSHDPEISRQATILAFDELLTEAEVHDWGPAGFWNAKGVARLQTGDLVYLTDVDIDDEGRHDFELRAIDALSFDLASWTKVVTGEKGARAGGLTVTPEGHIVVIGTSIQEGGTSMILQGLHP